MRRLREHRARMEAQFASQQVCRAGRGRRGEERAGRGGEGERGRRESGERRVERKRRTWLMTT